MLALLCSLIISSSAGFDPVLVLVLAGGTGIGVILPDIQMKRPKKTRLIMVAWYIVQIGRYVCIPVMRGIYRLIMGAVIKPDDKRMSHSIPGILIYFTILTGIFSIPVILFRNSLLNFLMTVFLGGIFFGLLLHLIEDCCTRKGIPVFYPFSDTMVHGSIRPCDIYDKRIPQFHIQHSFTLGIILILQVTIKHGDLLAICGFLALCICSISMVSQSDIRIEYDTDRSLTTRETISV
jgi:hypothetical protein